MTVLPHVVFVAGMTLVLFFAWRSDHPGIEDEPKPPKSTTQRQAAPDIARLRLKVRMSSVGKALEASAYTTGPARGEAVSLLQW